jgi:hypothetical protein
MQRRKTNEVATINGVATITFDASVDFTTDIIEFPESIPWAVQFDEWDVADPELGETAPTVTILCSNSQFGDFLPYNSNSTDISLNSAPNRILYDSIFSPRYMKIAYTANDAVGDFNLVISK